jgi:DNA-binding CsgD family transcriptional regulator
VQSEELAFLFKRFNVHYLGYGLFWAWVFLCFDKSIFFFWDYLGLASTMLAHLLSLLASIPVLCLATFLYKPVHRLLGNRAFTVSMALLMAVGTLLNTLQVLETMHALQMAGAVLTGLASPCLLLLWGERYGELEPRQNIVYTALSYLVAILIFLVISGLDIIASSIFSSLLPLLSFLSHRYCHKTSMTEEHAPSPQKSTTIFDWHSWGESRSVLSLRILCGLFVVMFVYGGALVYHSKIFPGGTTHFLLTALPVLLVTLGTLSFGLFMSKKVINLGTGFRFSLMFIAALFIPLALLDQSFTEFSEFFASVGINLIEILTWILLVYLARASSAPRFPVFAACYAVAHGGMAAGELAGILLLDYMLVFSVLSICALVVLAGFFFTDRETIIHFDPLKPDELSAGASKSGLMEHAVELIAVEHNLSEREQEVFSLWATGYGAKAIESKLIISASTVKTHIQHIYEKCDVHSRTEIIGLLEAYSAKAEENSPSS